MKSSIAFKCQICGQEPILVRSYGGMAGFEDCVEWLAPVPGPDPARRLLLRKPPRLSEKHWLAVRFPFYATAQEPFWCLFKPPRSYLNGWADHPQGIPHSSLNECRLLEVRDVERATAKVRVKVERTVSLTQIAGELPVIDHTGVWFDWMDNRRVWMARSGAFTHLSYNLEGDAGSWVVVEKRLDRHHVILLGEWGWHISYFRAENQPLSERALAAVAKIERLRKQGQPLFWSPAEPERSHDEPVHR